MHVLASAVSIGIVKNHAFVDGNKRAAFMALNMTLDENGFRLDLSPDEAVELIEGIAKAEHEGGLAENTFEEIVKQGTRPWSRTSIGFDGPQGYFLFDIVPSETASGWIATCGFNDFDIKLEARTYYRLMEKAWDEAQFFEPPEKDDDDALGPEV